ncbi:TlpA disulfide reductase family protein [Chryseolinea lacunae]|nr:TlpA disulfide reductase family protein [Chryseolinea lacunae]
MHKIIKITCLVVLTLATSSLYAQKGFTLAGSIKGLSVKYMYMRYQVKGVESFDSCLVKNGTFSFKGKVGAEPTMGIIYSPEARFQKVFYIENLPMKVEGTSDALTNLKVSGSPAQNDFTVLEDGVQVLRNKVTALYTQSEKAKKEADSLYNSEKDLRKQFVLTHPKSYASLNELLNWVGEDNLDEATNIYNGLDANLKKTEKAAEIVARIENLKKTKVGNGFIDFKQTDLDGKTVSLSSYKGNYVLLEFWASWCGPCRQENPNLKKEYELYKDKGFQVLGVSLDDNATKWKKAIEKDGLPWAHVSDLKGWNNEAAVQYGVRAIPANFLIDPQGKIIARNLRGEELAKKLEEIFH